MPLERTVYRFRQRLLASRRSAFHWATDYRPGDLALMGEDGRRQVKKLAPDLILLTDRFRTPRGSIVKEKLVHLLPDRWAWTSTHLSGPSRHSQFLYELRPLGKKSCELQFTGLQVDRVRRPLSGMARKRRVLQLLREDSGAWRRLGAAIHLDLR